MNPQKTSAIDFLNKNNIKYQPLNVSIVKTIEGKLEKHMDPKYTKIIKTSDFNPNNPISDDILNQRKIDYKHFSHLAIDTWEIIQIDIDEKVYDPIFDEYMKTMPYFISTRKKLPHIFVKSTNKINVQKIACKGKYKGVDILAGQWAWINRDQEIINGDLPIQEIDLTFIINEKDEEEEKKEEKIKVVKKEENNKPVKINSNQIMFSGNKGFLKKLLDCIDNERADNYGEWMSVGFALYNINSDNLDLWDEFSKRSKKYKDGECAKIWKKLNQGTISIGTIKWYAKQDNPTKYNEIINGSIEGKIDKAICSGGADTDIADVVFDMYEGEFVFNNESWFYFDCKKHKWIKTKNTCKLRENLRDVSDQFMIRSAYWATEAAKKDSDEDYKLVCAKKASGASGIAIQLRKTILKNNIITECKCLFNDDGKFDQNLDLKGYLIGFTNGVMDLRNFEFRDGRPDDYISLSTEYDYITDFDKPVLERIKGFVNIIWPDPHDVKFWLDSMSYTLDGSLTKEDFFIHIGCGSNGKGFLTELMIFVFGEYYQSMNSKCLTVAKTQRSGAEPEIAKLKGARYVVAVELAANSSFQMDQIKAWTGGDRISARQCYKDDITFKPQFCLNCQANELPDIQNVKNAEARRVKVVHYPVQFCDDPNPRNPLEKPKDETLKPLFESDFQYRQAAMWWLIENYKTIKGTKLVKSPNCILYTKRYLSGTDIIKNWFEERMEYKDKSFTPSSQIYPDFSNWCKCSGIKTIPTAKNFKADFIQKFDMQESKRSVMGYKGISFQTDPLLESDEEEDDALEV
jgi:P4 family phage/plasmid primase-like protien